MFLVVRCLPPNGPFPPPLPPGFAKVEKRVRTAGGGSTGSVRNLRIREDTAKYLLNLDVNSGEGAQLSWFGGHCLVLKVGGWLVGGVVWAFGRA